MGTYGEIAVGARGQLSYKEETNWGWPLAPDQRVDFNTESFNNEIGNLTSEALNPSRGIAKQVRGVSNITGDVAHEQNTEGYEVWYKHALGDAVTLDKTDGGIRTRVASPGYTSGTTLTVEDTSSFEAAGGTDFDLIAVYKDADGILQSIDIDYSVAASSTTFTIVDPSQALPQGTWIFQKYIGGSAWWDSIYTHYIEAAADLPAGLTMEVGRDVAFFIYSGCKVNTVENTFTAQEILQSTFSFIGKAEYSGADLATATTDASTSISLTNFTLTYQNIGYAYSDDGGAFVDETDDANDDTAGDVSPFPAATVATDDAFYFGDDNPFTSVGILISQAAVATWTVAWEYYNGSTWTTLTLTQQDVDDFTEGTDSYTNAWDAPSDWATTTVNTQSAYWIRARISAFTSETTKVLITRIRLNQAIVGFPFGTDSVIQVEDENGVLYDGVDIDVSASTASLTGVSNWSSGSSHAAGKPVVAQEAWDNPSDPPTTDPLSSFQAAVYIDGDPQEVLSGSFTLNNNLFTDKYQLGDRYRAGLPEQQRTVEGLINVEFDDLVLYHRFINGTAAYLEFRCVDDSATIGSNGSDTTNDVYRQKHCILPNIKFTGTTPQIAGPEVIEHDMNFVALQDLTWGHNELIIIFVNTIDRNF